MPNEFGLSIDRRKFLRLGALGGAVVAGGCGGGDGVQTVTTPPVKGGNRAFLDDMKTKAALPKTKTKKR
jgi:hypothetical protein